jgi:CelD/BcsL family acetyltransferase involved in cellulose biosynthesis
MVIGVLSGRDLPHSTEDTWSELQLAQPTLASPFFRPEFTRLVATARGDVHVAVLEGGCFFPFQRSGMGIGLPVGSRLSDHHGLVAPPETEVDVATLLKACQLATWEFDGLPAAQRAFAPFQRVPRASPVIDLANGYESYAASRREAGSDVLADAAKQGERLAHRVGPTRFEAHVGEPSVLEVLLAWKSAQYARTGAVDIFRFDWVRDVVRRAHAAREPAFAGLLSVLYAGGIPVAMHLGLRSASVWHYWLPAYDRRYAAYSPGIVLLTLMAQAAPDLGLTTIDLGKGEALYKRRFASSEIRLAAGVVRRRSPAALAERIESASLRLLQRTPAAAIVQRSATRRRLR